MRGAGRYETVSATELLPGDIRGVGIPHAKFDGIKDVVGAFGRVQPGLDWSAVDGEPVQLVFVILAPPSKGDAYLQILMAALKKPNFVKFLKSVKTAKDIEEVFREVEEPAPV